MRDGPFWVVLAGFIQASIDKALAFAMAVLILSAVAKDRISVGESMLNPFASQWMADASAILRFRAGSTPLTSNIVAPVPSLKVYRATKFGFCCCVDFSWGVSMFSTAELQAVNNINNTQTVRVRIDEGMCRKPNSDLLLLKIITQLHRQH